MAVLFKLQGREVSRGILGNGHGEPVGEKNVMPNPRFETYSLGVLADLLGVFTELGGASLLQGDGDARNRVVVRATLLTRCEGRVGQPEAFMPGSLNGHIRRRRFQSWQKWRDGERATRVCLFDRTATLSIPTP